MTYSVLRRTLRPGVSFEEFRDAWTPPAGLAHLDFTVAHSRSLTEDRVILSIGTHDMSPEEFNAFAASDDFASVNEERHRRIAPLVEEEDGFIGAFELLEGDRIAI